MYEITVTRDFSSAHYLHDYEGKCANLHGHNWKVAISFRGKELARNGILIDFLDIGKALDGLLEKLDHGVINEIPPFDVMNPTAENLARWFHAEVSQKLPPGAPQPHRVTVWETPDASASFWEDEP
ncbi:MAG: 6-carboxytetrahydropterin synthase QueD [Candidatus Omnitrophota bacterium]|jgi:6-pyruvoyltetrahydropterin/6-carboxytetrahydropterin synthase|nr:MAG: 6-carboxytetrahydropterin synthase QueD [Candidatus Omnitrophota bacterium]